MCKKSAVCFATLFRQETSMNQRVVEENEHFVVLSPYAARFPFELQIYPRRHNHDFSQLTGDEIASLGETLRRSLKRIKETLGNPATPDDSVCATWRAAHRPGRVLECCAAGISLAHRHFAAPDQVAGFEWGTGFYITRFRRKAPLNTCAKRRFEH
jgi:UDPglucose--hexose-1-phosphate uridylyltransferase